MKVLYLASFNLPRFIHFFLRAYLFYFLAAKMSSEYDRKFDEMKKYIPFLESMIKRLESTTSTASSNPRLAQLDKIRSLRDLLLDKKKRCF